MPVPYFLLRCADNAGVSHLRAQHREAHVGHVRGSGETRIAGPLLDGSGGVCGSLLIVETDDLDQARAFSEADPFFVAGVYASVEILPFRMTYTDIAQGGGGSGN